MKHGNFNWGAELLNDESKEKEKKDKKKESPKKDKKKESL